MSLSEAGLQGVLYEGDWRSYECGRETKSREEKVRGVRSKRSERNARLNAFCGRLAQEDTRLRSVQGHSRFCVIHTLSGCGPGGQAR